MKNTHWRTIAALTAVSTFAQLGQFGVGFLVLPIWLAARGVGALALGFFGAAEWAGMLVGLLVTPQLLMQFTSKRVVFFGSSSIFSARILRPKRSAARLLAIAAVPSAKIESLAAYAVAGGHGFRSCVSHRCVVLLPR